MKKLFLGSVLSTFVLLAGCQGAFQPFDGGGYYYKPDNYGHPGYNGQMTQMGNGNRGSRPKPRPYSVTPKDEGKYQNLNDQIDQRLQNINNSNSSTAGQPQANPEPTAAQSSQTSGQSSTSNSLPHPGTSN